MTCTVYLGYMGVSFILKSKSDLFRNWLFGLLFKPYEISVLSLENTLVYYTCPKPQYKIVIIILQNIKWPAKTDELKDGYKINTINEGCIRLDQIWGLFTNQQITFRKPFQIVILTLPDFKA